MDKDLSREIILENFQNPYHKEEVQDEHYSDKEGRDVGPFPHARLRLPRGRPYLCDR